MKGIRKRVPIFCAITPGHEVRNDKPGDYNQKCSGWERSEENENRKNSFKLQHTNVSEHAMLHLSFRRDGIIRGKVGENNNELKTFEKLFENHKGDKTMRNKFIHKIAAVGIAAISTVGLFAGCAQNVATVNANEKDSADSAVVEEVVVEETVTESRGTITVAASPTPHAEILAEAAKILEKEGWKLEVTEFEDYVQPNLVVEDGDIDANYFQHTPYLDNFNEEKGTHLVSIAGVHYEPFGIYPGTKASLDDIEKGDTIAVPNDTTNEARALLLLQDNGIIKLKEGAGLTATVLDIEENPYDIKIQELEAAQVSRVKDEVAYVVLNGNYALEAGFSVAKDSIAYEKSDSDAAKTYVNILVVKEGNENNEGLQALAKVLKSDEIKEYINNTYDGAVVPFEE